MISIITVVMGIALTISIAQYKNRNPLLWVLIVAVTNIFGLMALIMLPVHQRNSYTARVIDIREAQRHRKSQMVLCIVNLLAKLCQADHKVSERERTLIDQFLRTNLALEGEALAEAEQMLQEALQKNEPFNLYASQLRAFVHHPNDLIGLIAVMFELAASDGVTPSEEAMIDDTAKILGLYNSDIYRTLKAKYVRSVDDLQKYYEILECKVGSTAAEIKRSYHKLLTKYHPDKYASDDVSSEQKAFVYQKTLEIREAYDAIMASGHVGA